MRHLRNTKLILIEGIPGSGKSTLAQFIAQAFAHQNIACQWWYEEEKDHPLYVFHDQASLQRTIDDLSSGRYCEVIAAALEKWKAFVQKLQSSDKVVILDGCLFGYLTWSLFPLDIPVEEIRAYLSQIKQIILPIRPCLIYLYQQDTAQALEKICERRGDETQSRFIAQATLSAYGQNRGLQGFDGMVTFWKDFRILVEATFSRLDISKLALENSAGDWQAYEQNVLDFLNLPAQEEAHVPLASLERFAGIYHFENSEGQQSCLVQIENDHLIIDGMPQVWRRTRLIPWSRDVFAIASLPFQIIFEEDTNGTITSMRASGPELLFGDVDRLFVRETD